MMPWRWSKLMLTGLLAASVAIAGCNDAGETTDPVGGEDPGVVEQPPEDPVDEETPEEKLAQEWEALKEEATEAAELIAFLDARLSEAEQEQADAMVRDVFAFYEQDLSYSQEQFFSQDLQPVLINVQLPVTEDNVSEVPDETVRELILSKLKGNYTFITTEGSFFPIVDYGAFQAYEDTLSYDLVAYINLKAMESDEISASDGGLIVGWDELARRLLTAEDYLKLYAGSPEADEVRDIYLNDYLPKYMYGLNNTPNYDFETMQVTAEAKASYEATASEHPDSVTGQLVQGFLDVLVETEGQIFTGTFEEPTEVPEVKSYRDNLEKEFDNLMAQQAEIS
ncbi:hypothetical protein [Paenibacillus daejeonensis]|uniref:hypothetical protein n=1 Tax=Paenibacillus daejeonensis TaxID=135193 RepID=UPI00037C256E|nr:hypothetical protein [Paenibacillus daejeonensis]